MTNCHSRIVNLDHKSRVLSFNRIEGKLQSKFPYVWLRDNCPCANCYHPNSNARKIDCETFDTNSEPKEAIFVPEGLKLVWNDNHESVYSIEWLTARDFSEDVRQKYLTESYRPEKRIWGKEEFKEVCKSFDYNKIMEDDEELLNWLEALSAYGIALVKNTPSTGTEIRQIIERVGFIKRTHFGDEFVLKYKEGAYNFSYVGSALQLHSDLPYYDYKPGTNLLHCLVQSKMGGGQNTIVDGFYAADRMRKLYPEDFEVLTKVLVNWRDKGVDCGVAYDKIIRSPLICVDQFGEIVGINFNCHQRDNFFTVPLEEVQPWYNALAKITKVIHEQVVEVRTEPGDILTFDNIRLLHGRKAFTDTKDNTRHLVGAYLDWDEIFSKIRVLKENKNKM